VFDQLKQWWRQRIIDQSPITDEQWREAFSRLPLLKRLTEQEKLELRHLAVLFLHKKTLEGARGVQINESMSLIIALQACLPVLKLGLQWYQGWVSVIVYPDAYAPEHTYTDEAGVVHRVRRPLSGESWLRGPVILSWNDTLHSGAIDGHNLVIHEFAHKLDMLNGAANGYPPLHRGMSTTDWSTAFGNAFAQFEKQWQAGLPLPFDGYAAESPAEFFAVLSEIFFEQPERIAAVYPDVYAQLKVFYRQDPLEKV
jgi:Mlc titration factor MtfA (ptsG expression regulator)